MTDSTCSKPQGTTEPKPPPLLDANIRFIWQRAEEILARPELYFCTPPNAGMSIMLIDGGPVCLGVLLELWRAGALVLVCPTCRGRLLVYFVGGSPLSGNHAFSGVCLDCGAYDHFGPKHLGKRDGYNDFGDQDVYPRTL